MADRLLPDLLAGLSSAARLRKEGAAAAYVMHANAGRNFANREAMSIADNTFAGNKAIAAGELKPFDSAEHAGQIDVVICARVDLDHPVYFADNRFASCGDCGCDLQYRPAAPEGPAKLCICCAARRLRSEGGDG